MQSEHSAHAGLWFRSAAGRRYGRDFAFLILVKIVLLMILYFVFVAPQPRADTSPTAMSARLTSATIPDGENQKATVADHALNVDSP